MTEATTHDAASTGTESRLLFLHAQTPLHPGSGAALDVIDLPVQRERHTEWPLVPGSALKGILRNACRRQLGNNGELFTVFGPETAEADKHAGALSITDARILAFPVRSLKGVFAWVTCPAVLNRLARDLSLAEQDAGAISRLPAVECETVLCPEGSPLLVDGDKLVLEEFEFTRLADNGPTTDAGSVARWIAQHALRDDFTKDRLETHLVVLNDDDFTHFVRRATEVVARIGLDYERKTVKSGALFYQEFLPAETLFYCVVFASASRRDGDTKSAGQIVDYVRKNLPNVLQVGGDETTGKGLCAVRLSDAKET